MRSVPVLLTTPLNTLLTYTVLHITHEAVAMAGVAEEKRFESVPQAGNNDSGDLPVKESIEDSDHLRTVHAGIPDNDVLAELPAKEQTKILRKVDYRLVPLLTFLYLVAFVDRTNSESILLVNAPALLLEAVANLERRNANKVQLAMLR